MNLEERFSMARTELDTMFSNTDVPPAAGVRRRHRRRRVAEAATAGLAALGLVFGTAVIVNADNSRDKEPFVADQTAGSAAATSTTTPATAPAGVPVVEITARVSLRYEPTTIPAPTGQVWIVLISEGGSHTLAFETPGVMERPLTVKSRGRDEGLATFSTPGEYVFFDSITGHREAGEEGRFVVTADGQTSTTTVAPGIQPSGVPHPAGLIGATPDGRIVEIDDNGGIGRELFRVGGLPIHEMQIVGDELWFRGGTDEYCGTVYRVPMTGGQPEPVLDELVASFAVSDDRTRLAYFQGGSCSLGDWTSGGTLTMENLTTGARATWSTPEQSDDFFEVNSVTSEFVWSPDGSTLAASWCYEGCAIQLHDPEQSGTFTYANTIMGESPLYTDDVMWAQESVYGDLPEGEVPALLRYDSPAANAAPDEFPSPFLDPNGVGELLEGANATLVAVSGGYRDVPLRVQTWDGTNGGVRATDIDPGIRTITTR